MDNQIKVASYKCAFKLVQMILGTDIKFDGVKEYYYENEDNSFYADKIVEYSKGNLQVIYYVFSDEESEEIGFIIKSGNVEVSIITNTVFEVIFKDCITDFEKISEFANFWKKQLFETPTEKTKGESGVVDFVNVA